MIQQVENDRQPRRSGQILRLGLKHLRSILLDQLATTYAWLHLKSWGVHVGRRLKVRGCLHVHNGGVFRIADDVRINSGSANYVGRERGMSFWVSSSGSLEIGSGCAMSNSTIICRQRISIGDDVFIGGGCDLYDNDFHQLMPQPRIENRGPIGQGPIVIESQAFIGARTIILKDVTIGRGAVIGAGSVVTRSVPAFEVWAGVPARFIRKLDLDRSASDVHDQV